MFGLSWPMVGVSVTHVLRTVISGVRSSFERPPGYPKNCGLRLSAEFVFQEHFKQICWWKRQRKMFALGGVRDGRVD